MRRPTERPRTKFALQFFVVVALAFSFRSASSAELASENLAQVPAGQLNPFWQTTLSKKEKKGKAAPIAVSGFASMTKQVTVGQFIRFLESNPEWKKENISSLFADESYLINLKGPKIDDDSPMTSVSWFAAKAYCESVHLRLPTTNEWEYMAAASETKVDPTKARAFLQRILDWYGEPQVGPIKKVGSIYKNLYGIWDLHGLVWEWVSDFNSNFVTGESREDTSFNKDMFCGSGALAGANKEDYAAFMRFAFRSGLKGKSSVGNLGFRCVK